MQLNGFEERSVLVTGAAGGIGLKAAALLHAAGAKVVATDTEATLDAMPSEDMPDAVAWLACDLRDAVAVATMVEEAETIAGPLSLGVHAAGVVSTTPLLDTSVEAWQHVQDINLNGSFHVMQCLGKRLITQPNAALVVISSNAATIPRLNMGAYCASKAALTMLTRCLGLELAQHGVRCNVIAPGSTLTPMQTGMWHDEQGPARVIAGDLASYRTGIPLGKLATPEDIAQAALFLLSDQAGHITMADLYIDGGATLRG
ncbi:2,3-dihydro-2,3-dihydroxybenzoate dehydrogenase [Loktanella sp. D2R18]|uniref:SDR family oxidoreductase n=1 Tax=Rhodobacterales TaxID=204455 RepID=UPI000DEA61A8|nr:MULTISPECIES: SDR family oxidoreductase [Rhodobacterales]MDO6592026.1 SDR family oxidoreductase [Yoonia sp. 1_MG-2023]RBW44985.1 2,3-dihydro-2,3-dihydroxybenzoate dehydrogenase [Loktanella sp. D2R18]